MALAGLVTLFGWWSGNPAVVQPRPHDPALPANAALCFLLLGGAAIALEFGARRTSLGLAAAAAALAAVAVLEHIAGRTPGLDDMLVVHRAVIDSRGVGRIPPVLGGMLLAAALLIGGPAFRRATLRPNRPVLLALAGSLLTAYAVTAAFAARTGLHAQPAWQETARLGVLGAAIVALLALGLFGLAARETVPEADPGRWLWMPVVAGGLTLTGLFWFALHERELAYLNATTRLTADNFASLYSAELRAKTESLRRMASRWTQAGGTREADWQHDASAQFNDFPAYRALVWVDAHRRTRWLYPTFGNEDQVSFDHGTDPLRAAAMREAHRGVDVAMAGPLVTPLRPAYFAAYAPVARNGQPDGFLVAEMYYDRLVEIALGRLDLAERYAVRIAIGPEGGDERLLEVLSSEPAGLERAGRRAQTVTYRVPGHRLQITAAPREGAGGLPGRQWLPELALVSGLGVTFLLGLVVNLARAAHFRRRAAERTSAALRAENEERRRVEAQLKRTDERLNLALNATLVGVFEWDVPAGHVFYTPSVWQSLGYQPDAEEGALEAWVQLIHPDDLALFHEANARHFRGETALLEPEYRVRLADGEWGWVAVRAKCVAYDAAGNPQKVIGTTQNVTARKKAEEALRTSQAAARMLSHVASRTENPVVITSPAGMIEWVNESFTRLTGLPAADARGVLLLDLLASPDDDAQALERVTGALVRREPLTTDVVALSRDKERRYHLRLELQPVRNAAGATENFIALGTDMTARVETENELRRAKAEADAASRAKSDFLASMSHEIRTPMNGVIGMTSLLLETELTAEQKDYVGTIRTSGDALLAIINEILDFSKIESGRMELERQPFELAQCLEEALDIFALQAAAKGIELAYYIDSAVPPWVEGDMTRLRQVLVNLVNNAVKFTPHGSVTVEVHVATVETGPGFHVAHEDAGRLMLDFFVTDTGIGIPADRQHLLFQPFSQVDTSTTRRFGGTGLGLAICDRLCHLMGGSIDVTSKPGEGSTFRFSIAVQPVAALVEEVLPPIPDRFHGRPVLIMDDHAINRAILGRAASTLGFTPLETHNLYNAAELAVQHKLAAAVIDDGGEYGEKGSMLAHQLREQHPKLPIVLYISPVDTGRRSDTTDPFLVRLTKPIKPALLRQVLAGLFQEPDAAETRPPVAMPDDGPRLAANVPLDILLVEDNPVNQKVALRFLDRLGYRADAVGNGVEAVRTLQQRDYDLVFMDVQMPEMDGFTATREIRKKLPPARQPRIIALTANAVQGDRERCLQAGMDDYLSKPVKLEALELVIRKHFGPAGQ